MQSLGFAVSKAGCRWSAGGRVLPRGEVALSGARWYRPYNYQRFNTTKSLLQRWAASPTFYYQVAGLSAGCGGFYVYNLETVPISQRKRFNIISPGYERKSGEQMYHEILRENAGRILPQHHPQHRMVQRVLDRLIPHSGLAAEDQQWQVHVIQDPRQTNAFVIPGGKVFVYTGILDVCHGEDGLAAVLGHEIAHNVAHHAAEKMSRSMIFLPIALVASLALGFYDTGLTNMAVELGFLRPNGRKQESEADHIGLLMMAKACYDPQAAVGLWQRMQRLEAATGAPPQFISTHPSIHNRIEFIQRRLPDAMSAQAESECYTTTGNARQFWRAVSRD